MHAYIYIVDESFRSLGDACRWGAAGAWHGLHLQAARVGWPPLVLLDGVLARDAGAESVSS